MINAIGSGALDALTTTIGLVFLFTYYYGLYRLIEWGKSGPTKEAIPIYLLALFLGILPITMIIALENYYYYG